MEYPLAPNGIFWTIQGEGDLLGEPSVFIRLAGCPVGCLGCDTNYTVSERVTDTEIVLRALELRTNGTQWVWITGGEPTIHPIAPLLRQLESKGFKTAVATAGINDVWRLSPAFLSVSPHSLDSKWKQRHGSQVNVVPGLDGLSMDDIQAAENAGLFNNFKSKWMTPCWTIRDGPSNLGEVLEFIRQNKGWKLGIQSHKVWSLP